MKKTLQNQYQLIKEGKSSKDVFLKEAKTQFPQYVRNAASYNEAVASLKTKGIISENLVSLSPINTISSKQEDYEVEFKKFLQEAKEEAESEKVKADNTKPAESPNIYDREDKKNMDNVLFDQLLTGYYLEMKNPKNSDKTIEEVKEIVFKNLQKDPIFYVKNGQFGLEDVGYTDETPGIKVPKVQDDPSKPYKYETVSLNENVDEVRGGGNYGMMTINIKNPKKDREERDPTDKYLTFDKDFEKIERRKGNLIVKDNDKIFITKVLHANLGPKSGNADLRKHLMDRSNLEPSIIGGKPVFKIKNAKINSKGNISVFIPVKQIQENNNMTLQEQKLRKIVRAIIKEEISKHPLNENIKIKSIGDSNEKYGIVDTKLIDELLNQIGPYIGYPTTWKEKITNPDYKGIIQKIAKHITNHGPLQSDRVDFVSEELNENIQKRLKEIEVESMDEVKQAKLSKLQDEIKKRQDQLDMIESNEDLKALTDKKKIKELEREIKELERACSKLDKGNKKKEIIDETEDQPSAEYLAAKEDAEGRYEAGEDIESILADYPKFKDTLEQDIIGGFEGQDY